MLVRVGVSYRISYSIVGYLYVRLPRLGKKALIFQISFACKYVVLLRRGFLFLMVLRIGCVVLL